MNKQPILYIVIPCYNEQEVLPITAPLFLQKIQQLSEAGKISPDSRVLFVNDGSKDRTGRSLASLPRVMSLSSAFAKAAAAATRMLCWPG